MKTLVPHQRPLKAKIADEDLKFSSVTLDLAVEILDLLDTPLSILLASLIRQKDFTMVIELCDNFTPHDYTDLELFRRDYLAVSLLSKNPEMDLGVDRAQSAINKFRTSELSCEAVNNTLESLLVTGFSDTAAVMFMARRKIANLLPELSADLFIEGIGWGPGATTSKKRLQGDIAYKFGDKTDASFNLAPLVPLLLEWYSPWTPTVRYVSGGRGTTVPKSAKTDRFIMIEPDLNGLAQKGLGNIIRKALHKVGLLCNDNRLDWDARKDLPIESSLQSIDLNKVNAQELNALLAREGSITGSLATIDLSSASDSLSLKLIEELLPQDYFQLIKMTRSPVCTLPDGEVVTLQKVSSMGNGFTFELETLIFWALARSYIDLKGYREHRVQVYGDDIIIASEAAPGFSCVLLDLGFSLNKEKSFWSGPFRESCGKHYMCGHDVTPFFIRSPIDKISRIFWLINSIKAWSSLPGYGIHSLLLAAYNRALELLPVTYKELLVPPEAGRSTGIWADLDVAISAKAVRFHRGYGRGWLYRGLITSNVTRRFCHEGRLLKSLYLLEKSGEVSEFADPMYAGPSRVPRHFGKRIRVNHYSYSPSWRDFGPWL